MKQSWETKTSVSAGHIILTPIQPVGRGRPQRESNPGPPHQELRALPTEPPHPQRDLGRARETERDREKERDTERDTEMDGGTQRGMNTVSEEERELDKKKDDGHDLILFLNFRPDQLGRI